MTPAVPPLPRTPRQTFQCVGMFFAYVYLLRVPLLICTLVAALPWIALPRDAVAGSLLRGLFDIADPGNGRAVWTFTFALLTGTALMVAASMVITARLILRDGHARFEVGRLPPSRGIQLVVRLVPALSVAGLVGGAWIQSAGTVGLLAPVVGIAIGSALFVFTMTTVHNWLWDALFKRKSFLSVNPALLAIADWPMRVFRAFVRLTPEGFVDAGGRLWARHAFAQLQFLFSLTFYVVVFLGKTYVPGLGGIEPRVPTLCLVLVLMMLACWVLSALTFAFDRFRVPLLTLLFAYGSVISVFTWNDHFFQTVPHRSVVNPSAGAVLKHWAGRPVIVVAAAGGGIQAAAWTARVLASLQDDSIKCGDDFDGSVAAISAVSGGSTGAMYIIDAYRNGHLDPTALGEAVKAAEASSLDNVAWGLAYPDLVWTVAPFLKGLYRPFLVKDRGSALEDSWKRTTTLGTATLDDWREDVAAEPKPRRPAVLFNATVAESGQRIVFASTTLTTGLDPQERADPGRREFARDFPELDIPVTTAARLSATFPYVSPAARVNRYAGFDEQYHYVDGGYYDNYGTATLLQWLADGITALGADRPQRVLLLEIRSFPDGDPAAPTGSRGWTTELLQPLKTLYEVRGAGQQSQSDLNVRLLSGEYSPSFVQDVHFTFPTSLSDAQDDPSPPLSWHLTPSDRGRLEDAWTRDTQSTILPARVQVHHFLNADKGPVSDACLAKP
jgi:hypothetical protein